MEDSGWWIVGSLKSCCGGLKFLRDNRGEMHVRFFARFLLPFILLPRRVLPLIGEPDAAATDAADRCRSYAKSVGVVMFGKSST